MPETELEERKDALIRIITEDYARDAMQMPAFELAVTRISACADLAALAAEASSLGLALPPQAPVAAFEQPSAALEPRSGAVELACTSGRIRESGDWLRSRLYRFALKSSTARLDLRAYEGAEGFRLLIEIDAVSSGIRLIVPRGFQVEDRISERASSVLRNRPRGGSFGDNRVLLTGSLRSSVLKVRYR
jgi:hypothetical protein